jgi:hypothetical protein
VQGERDVNVKKLKMMEEVKLDMDERQCLRWLIVLLDI